MGRLGDLDELVVYAFEHWHDEPHRDSVYVPGDSNADAIERLRQEMTEALKDADATAIASIAASYGEKIAQLEAQPNRPAHGSTPRPASRSASTSCHWTWTADATT